MVHYAVRVSAWTGRFAPMTSMPDAALFVHYGAGTLTHLRGQNTAAGVLEVGAGDHHLRGPAAAAGVRGIEAAVVAAQEQEDRNSERSGAGDHHLRGLAVAVAVAVKQK